jgi:hypothetical protein
MKLTVSICALMILAIMSCSPNYAILQDFDTPPSSNETICIGEIEDALSADVSAKDRPSAESIEKLRGFLKQRLNQDDIFDVMSSSSGSECEESYEVVGKILKYNKGSGVARFLIGFGAGSSYLTVNLSIIDKSNNQQIFSGNFKASVSSWLESGDTALRNVAKDFAKAIKESRKKQS